MMLSLVDLKSHGKARDRLMRLNEHRARVGDDIARLQAGRTKLNRQIADARAEVARQDDEVTQRAANIVGQIKKGLDFALHFGRVKESVPDLSVAQKALERLDAEIAQREADLTALDTEAVSARRAVLLDEAGPLLKRYTKAIAETRAYALLLEGLERHLGEPRYERRTFDLPGFPLLGADQIPKRPVVLTQGELTELVADWRRFEEALVDPSARASSFIRKLKGTPPEESVVYHDFSKTERELVDLRFATNSNARKG